MSEETTITIDPTPEKRPVVPEGTYGADGEAELRYFRPGTVKFGRDKGKHAINARVSVLTDQGYVTIFHDFLLEGQMKNRTLATLKKIAGVDMSALPKDEAGNVTLTAEDTAHVEGSKVIADVSYREWPAGTSKDGRPYEAGEANGIRSITLRQ